MKLEDLRIGNYVIQKGSNFIETVTLELLNRIDIILAPIPLTEEILLRLGFEYYEPLRHFRIVIDDVWYWVKSVNGKFLFSLTNLNYDEKNHLPPLKIDFVHDLQNVFYCFEKTELTLNREK